MGFDGAAYVAIMGDAIAQRSFRKRKYGTSERVLRLEKSLDLSIFVRQLETLIAMPIKIPSAHVPFPKNNTQNFFSAKGIWSDEEVHRAEVSKLFNSVNIDNERKELLSLMVDESDSDSSGEPQPLTVTNLHQMLKIHRKRRHYQTKMNDDPLNTQYKYYGAGLMSVYDRFPENQKEVKKAFSYNLFSDEEKMEIEQLQQQQELAIAFDEEQMFATPQHPSVSSEPEVLEEMQQEF